MGFLDDVSKSASSMKDVENAKQTINSSKDAGKAIQGGMGSFLGDITDIASKGPSPSSVFKAATSAQNLMGTIAQAITGSENDSFHGKIEVGGKRYGIVECKYRFFQLCDSTGKPSTRPRGGAITFVMPSLSDENVFFYKWMFSKTQVQSGVFKFVVYSQKNKRSYKTVSFKNAYCTELEDYFNDHDSRLVHTRVTIVAESISVGSNDVAEFSNDWT